VAALAARSAVMGAHLNVKINAKSVKDKAWIENVLRSASEMEQRAQAREREIMALVEPKL